jgi:hypothetical protein
VTTIGTPRSRAQRFTRGITAATIAIALWLVVVSVVRAASVDVGNHLLIANTPNQVITIQVTGGEQIAGEDFFAQLGDGGTSIGGSNTKPAFTNVDILAGTVFASNNSGAFGDRNGSPPGSNAAHPLIWVDGTITASGTVPASGVLAQLTIDTTGLSSGTFPLLLTGIAPSLGQFETTLRNAAGAAIPLTVINGSVTLSPYPLADYNHNGIVDAADYTVWRDTLGQTGLGLAADGDGNSIVDQADYDVWKMQFGNTVGGSGASVAGRLSDGAVPEPSTCVLLVAAALVLACLRSTTRFSRRS